MVSQSFDSNSDTELAGSARLRWLVSVNKRLMKQLVTGGSCRFIGAGREHFFKEEKRFTFLLKFT